MRYRAATYRRLSFPMKAVPMFCLSARSLLVLCALLLAVTASSRFVPVIGAEPAASDPTDKVVIEKNVAYLPADRTEKADLYLPSKRAAEVRSPAVVIIHGGGWSGGKKDAAREINIGTNGLKWNIACLHKLSS